jgi:hypothetical protein
MSFLSRFSPLPAIRDLRFFLSQRSKHELWFGILAIILTGAILVGLQVDSKFERPYKREITYFENWPENRTDAEIIAKQKVDQVAKEKRDAELKALQEKRRAEFKRVDDALESWGI